MRQQLKASKLLLQDVSGQGDVTGVQEDGAAESLALQGMQAQLNNWQLSLQGAVSSHHSLQV